MSPQDERHKNNMDKIGKIEAERKVWVGGLPKDLSWGKLEKHFKELDCKPSMTEILSKGKGTAVLAYKTADEASTAIAVVNGSEIDGHTIEVDVWTQKEKGDRPKKVKKDGGGEEGGVKKKKKKKSAGKVNKMAERMAA